MHLSQKINELEQRVRELERKVYVLDSQRTHYVLGPPLGSQGGYRNERDVKLNALTDALKNLKLEEV